MFRFYSGLSVSKQLFSANAAICALVICAALAALLSVQSVKQANATGRVFTDGQLALSTALRGVNESILTEGSSASIALAKSGMSDFEAALAELMPLVEKDEARREEMEKIVQQWKDLAAQIEPFLNNKNLSAEDSDTMIAFGKIIGVSTDLVKAMDGLAEEIRIEGTASSNRVINIMMVTFILILLGVILVSYVLFRSVTRPLGEAVKVAKAMAAGDLTQEIEVASGVETGQLLQALKDTNESLKQIVHEVRDGTLSVSSASKEISSGNAELSHRTEEQASSLEETASAMEELTSTVKQNADNAIQATQLAVGATDVAVKGGEVVGQVVATMSSINESSKKIADIIGVIDSIAFQTNILALNAAVEAARAGEQGRGFAVVATEVRTLAQRSASAAKEIRELIVDSVDKVGTGTRLVDDAGKTMDEIVSAVRRVTDVMTEISAASQEQSSGINQINQAVTLMDKVTQQNAALVEEAAAAAESMDERAQSLAQVVAGFKLSQYAEQSLANVNNPVATITQMARRNASTMGAAAGEKKAAVRKIANARQGNDTWQEF